MSGSNTSLILKAQAELEAAPFLFSDLPEIDRAKSKFHCTGERLFRDRKDVYEAVVKLLAEPGVSVRTICRELHVSDHTIRSVAAREGTAIATVKKTVLANITHGLRLASERVIDVMPEASAKDALLGVGILTEKMQLLSGEATERVEHLEREDIFASFPEFVRQLEAATAAELKDGPSGMHLAGGNNLQNATLMNGDHEQLGGEVIDVDAAVASAPANMEEGQE